MKHALSALALVVCGYAGSSAAQQAPLRDEFFWLGEINKASAVINTDEGLLDKALAPRIAAGIVKVLKDGSPPGGRRPSSVITFEPLLIAAAGPEVTLLHAGRSSQDMHATYRAAILRDDLLNLADQLNKTAGTLVKLAAKHAGHHRSELHERRGRPAQQLRPLPARARRRAGAGRRPHPRGLRAR